MIRPGHHRPLGTVTVMRFPEWPRNPPTRRQPQLGDIAVQTEGPDGDPDDVQRAYEVVGVVETRTGYRLHMERVDYMSLPGSSDPEAIWTFFNLRKGER